MPRTGRERRWRKRSGLSRSTIGRIWPDPSLQLHLADGFKLSSDPLCTEKVVDLVGLAFTTTRGEVGGAVRG